LSGTGFGIKKMQIESVHNELIECLCDFADDNEIIPQINAKIQRFGEDAYPVLLHLLTHLDLSPLEAKRCWKDISEHNLEMNRRMGRPVNLRTAVCDYFCSINKTLRNPKVIEIQVFEQAVRTTKYDSLTGLFNRRYFDKTLEREFARAHRHNNNLSLLFLDLDFFKNVNDNYGHQAGDEALKFFAKLTLEAIRTEDIAARYGGEEIVVILPETSKVNALVLAERIRTRLEKTEIEYDGQKIGFTLSGGLASFPLDADTSSNLVKFADSALYKAKNSGRNQISFYSTDKRQFLRIDCSVNIEAMVLGKNDNKYLQAKSKNISDGGILFEHGTPFSMGQKLRLTIPINNRAPLIVLGTVVRVESFEAGSYDIGISFIRMDEENKCEISRFFVKDEGDLL
jgi:diguanylate cyclase (GGDEF)-like protein